jgi:protein TonB
VTGSVIVEATVAANGAVVSTKIVKSVPLLDEAAANAVRQWTFNPATINGVPIEVSTAVAVPFPNIVRVGGVVRAPTKVRDAAPVYPEGARASGVQGIVILELTLGVDGTVAEARVVRSVPGLDEAALAAVQQWAFTPTLLNGIPTRVLYNVTVSFQVG